MLRTPSPAPFLKCAKVLGGVPFRSPGCPTGPATTLASRTRPVPSASTQVSARVPGHLRLHLPEAPRDHSVRRWPCWRPFTGTGLAATGGSPCARVGMSLRRGWVAAQVAVHCAQGQATVAGWVHCARLGHCPGWLTAQGGSAAQGGVRRRVGPLPGWVTAQGGSLRSVGSAGFNTRGIEYMSLCLLLPCYICWFWVQSPKVDMPFIRILSLGVCTCPCLLRHPGQHLHQSSLPTMATGIG